MGLLKKFVNAQKEYNARQREELTLQKQEKEKWNEQHENSIKVVGIHGVLYIMEDRVQVHYSPIGYGKGYRDILFKDIVSIEFKYPSLASYGYIRFAYQGSRPVNPANIFSGDTVMFKKNKIREFQKAKAILDKKVYK
jgi:hypothetical protein